MSKLSQEWKMWLSKDHVEIDPFNAEKAIDELCDEIEALEKRLEGAEKDKARLDILQLQWEKGFGWAARTDNGGAFGRRYENLRQSIDESDWFIKERETVYSAMEAENAEL